MEHVISELDTLKILYQEILEGCSISYDPFAVFRHLTDLDNIEVLRQRLVFYRKYIAQGIPSEKDRLKEVISSEEWSAQKEDRIISLRYSISDNERNIINIIPQQQPLIRKAIERDRQELIELLGERHMVLNATAEELSLRDSSTYSLFLAASIDRKCTQPRFKTWAEFEALEVEELDRLVAQMDKAMAPFTEQNLKRICILPIFLNTLSYCKENLQIFLNKPIATMTNLQMQLCSGGIRNLNILSNSKGNPPDLFGDTKVDEVVDWYDLQYSIALGKRREDKSV